MPFDMSADDDDDSAYQAPAFTLANDSPSPELLLEHKDSQQQTQETLMHALNDLDDRSRQIVSRRWLTDNKSTLHELADEFGVSAERIRQIEKNAFNKIKTQFVA
jgi:RNA polymerase sigma-32 factor